MNQQIPIADATEDQLRAFGRSHLGLALPPNCKPETLVAKIKAAWNKDYIVVQEANADTAQDGSAPRPVTTAQSAPEKDKVRIIIQETEEAGGRDPVPVGVNGLIMLIPRGKEVDIPLPYFEVLQHAITYKYDPLPEGGINPIPRKVPLYPFQRVA